MRARNASAAPKLCGIRARALSAVALSVAVAARHMKAYDVRQVCGILSLMRQNRYTQVHRSNNNKNTATQKNTHHDDHQPQNCGAPTSVFGGSNECAACFCRRHNLTSERMYATSSTITSPPPVRPLTSQPVSQPRPMYGEWKMRHGFVAAARCSSPSPLKKCVVYIISKN